jgi:hypothetical protein
MRPGLVALEVGNWELEVDSEAAEVRSADLNSALRIRIPNCLLNWLQFAAIRDRLVRRDAHVERECGEARLPDLNPVRTRVDRQPLEEPVEVVHQADEVSVDVDLRVARADLQVQVADAVGCGIG